MKHFLLIKREGFTKDGALLTPRESALSLLNVGLWPLWKFTRNRKAICAGDQVAVYLSGGRNQTVIAKATVREVCAWTKNHAFTYPLILDGEPCSVLHLNCIVLFDQPKPVKPRLNRLSFFNGSPKWGVAFMGGTRALSQVDYQTLIE